MKRLLIPAGLAAVLLVGAGVAVASSAPTAGVKACVTGKGALALRKSNGKCPRGSKALTIARTGPRGATGRTGKQGPVGRQGPGATGVTITGAAAVTRVATVLGRDKLTLTCNPGAAQPVATLTYASGDGTKIDLLSGSLDLFNGTTQVSSDSNFNNYTVESAFLSAAYTSSYVMKTSAPGSNSNTRSHIHLLVTHGSRTGTLDFGVYVTGGYCVASVQVTPNS